MKTLLEQTKSFCEEAEWLGSPIHDAPKSQLVMLAEELTLTPASGSLHSQFGLLFRFLYGLKPDEAAVEETDIITRILNETSA